MERLIHTHSLVFAKEIFKSSFSCARCGWCCRENFNIKITKDILRPSNAISIFPDDIRRIVGGTGMKWDEIAQPDIYSCLSDQDNLWAIGWILRRNDDRECIFYKEGSCTIYNLRPMICRCYPYFLDEKCDIEVMHCEKSGNKMSMQSSEKMGHLVKHYELKKLRSYKHIIVQLGDLLKIDNLQALPKNYCENILVCDGERIMQKRLGVENP